MREICFGLFLAVSKIEHSCEPNPTYDMIGQELVLFTIKPIDSFAQIRINYLCPEELFLPKEDRKERLKKRQKFDCQCSRCLTE